MIINKEKKDFKEAKRLFLLDKDVYSKEKANAYTRKELEEIVKERKYEGYEMSIIDLVVEPDVMVKELKEWLRGWNPNAYWVLVFKL